MKKRTMLQSALILTCSGILVKILGAAYRIPLSSMLGTEQMGVYITAFHIYALISSLSMAGIPIAAAQLCAARLAVGDVQGAKNVYVVSRRLLVLLGSVCFLAMVFFSDAIAQLMHCPQAAPAIRAVSPSVLLGAFIAAHRARFQGMQNMQVIAISQLAEQVVRLGAGLVLAYVFLPMGQGMGAAGAMLGTTLSELAGYLCLRMLHKDHGGGRYDPAAAGILLRLALPLTFGACILPLSSVLENMMLVDRLALFGHTRAQALTDYGILNGMVTSIATLPVMFTGALSACLMPNIAASVARPDICRYRARQGITLAMVFGIAMSCGLYLVAHPVMTLLYPSLQGEELLLGVRLLRIGAISALPHSIAITCIGALQGLGRTKQCAACQLLCAVVKVTAAYFLLPHVGVAGYSIGAFIGALCSCICSVFMLRNACSGSLFSWKMVANCIFSAILMCSGILVLQRLVGCGTLYLCLSLIIGAVVYLLACAPVFKEEKIWERSPSLRSVRGKQIS